MDASRIVIIAVITVVCTLTDLRSRKVYNIVTLPAMLIGVILSVIVTLEGYTWLQSLGSSITGLVLPLILFYLPYRSGKFGAGDVKLMMGIGAVAGHIAGINIFIYSLAAGFFTSVLVMLYRGIFIERIKNMLLGVYLGTGADQRTSVPDEAGAFPYAVNFLLGLAFVVLLGEDYWILH